MTDKLQVFISYARADGEPFAISLVAALEAAGFDPFLDQQDIGGGEDWKARLTDLLKKADTVVYVITPRAVSSTHCVWEIEEAQRLSKRLIPVVADEVPIDAMPPALQRLNHIHFTRQLSFGEALRQLAGALRTDFDWVREHTRMGGLAADWHARDGQEEWLLRGDQLANANAWLAAWVPGAPEPTDLHRAYLKASAEAEAVRLSTERRQLDTIKLAQAERETALRRAGRANRRVLALAGVMMLGVIGGGAYAWKLEQEARLLQARLDEQQAAIELAQLTIDSLNGGASQPGRAAPAPDSRDDSGSPATGISPDVPSSTDTVREVPAETPRPRSPAAPAQGVFSAWNVDIFWCEGDREAANEPRARALETLLKTENAAQAAIGAQDGVLPIGRVRARPLTEETNARPGYRLRTHEIRAEDSEQTAAAQLRALIEPEAGVRFGERRATTRTEQYLSVFVCGE